jgi:hypothetical protein
VTVILTSLQIASATRNGAQGEDAWIVIRVSGERPVFPVLIEGALSAENLAAVLAANNDSQLEAALGERGVPAGAFTAPILVDFDGGGWRAPFAP